MNKSEKETYHMYGHTLLRVTLGFLFLAAGINKFSNPEGVAGMLAGIGFPIASIFAWILILSEVIFGLCIFIGYKVKYTAWPLVVIMIIAGLFVSLPNGGVTSSSFLFHLVSAAGLVTVAWTGPGKLAIIKER